MNTQKKTSFFSLKTIVIILSLLNLAALFLFDYKLPSFLSFNEEEASVLSDEKNPETSDSSNSAYTFSFDTDPLVYDGTEQLDLLSGVTLKDSGQTPVDTDIFVHITSTNSITEKEIEYFANTDAGRITAIRKLKLQNYTGPSITLPDTYPPVTDETLDSLLPSLVENAAFQVLDGYGNDIKSSVTASYTVSQENPSIVSYTFTVTNLFNDMTSVTAELPFSLSRPLILLSQPSVTIKTGDSFDAMAYIKTAVDVTGDSLSDRITVDGQVDTSVPGDYVLTYTAVGSSGDSSLPKILTVHVEE